MHRRNASNERVVRIRDITTDAIRNDVPSVALMYASQRRFENAEIAIPR
jgi:hypothetical protein